MAGVPLWTVFCLYIALSVRPLLSMGSNTHFLSPTLLCDPGYTLQSGSSDQCTQCPPGKYKNVKGNEDCLLCPYAKISNASGAASVGTCTSCPRWHFADKGSRWETDCVAPQPVRRVLRQRVTSTCKPTLPDCVDDVDCGGGRGTCRDGQCECRHQFKGRNCSFCQLGFDGENCTESCSLRRCSGHGRCRISAICECDKGYVATDSYTCTACPAGTFTNRTGSTKCLKCPLHSHSPLASTEHTACTCNSGYIGRFGACVACAAGKYSTGRAEISYDSCLDCPVHTHSLVGSDQISKCTCQPGQAPKVHTF
jgi:hypothetical protein